MNAASHEDQLRALAAEVSERMDRLRAEGVTIDTEGLDRRDRVAVLLNARLDRLRAPHSGVNVINAADRFRAR